MKEKPLSDKTFTDPVSTELIRNAFLSASEDMKATLARSAYTPVIYEMTDYSVAIYNEKAVLLGQSPGLPFFLGGLDETIKVVVDKVGLDNFNEGDVFVINDSYLTGSHLNDVDVLSPIVYRGGVIGFTITRAHWLDIGSKDAAYASDSTEIYQEGLRLGPIRVMDSGLWVQDVVDIMMLNSRLPRSLYGDLNAQIAASRMGERRVKEIVDRFGLEAVRLSMEKVFNNTEKVEREIITKIPDGVYKAEGWVDNDFQTDEPFLVKVKVTVSGSEMTINTYGSSRQRPGSTNCGYAQAISAARLAYNFLINPKGQVTGGSFRPLKIEVEPGSIFAAQEPAACLQYGTHTMLLDDLIIKALSSVMPDKVAAGLPGDAWNVIIIGNNPRNDEIFMSVEATAGGWGANTYHDGESAVIHLAAGDFRNIPVETVESKFPIKLLRYGLGIDSGGAGRSRGGLKIVRDYQLACPDARLSLWFERTVTPQWGLFGGREGSIPKVTVCYPDGTEKKMLKVNHVPIYDGTVIKVETSGGGGYGYPWERDAEKVRSDVSAGYVSEVEAAKLYGVHFKDDSLEIDYIKTEKARKFLAEAG